MQPSKSSLPQIVATSNGALKSNLAAALNVDTIPGMRLSTVEITTTTTELIILPLAHACGVMA